MNEEKAMEQTTIDGMRIVLEGPATLRESVIRPESPSFDPSAAAWQLTFCNESPRVFKAPLEEIGNGLVRVYTVGGKDPLVDNRTPPPPVDGKVTALEPGASVSVPLDFSYPQSLMPSPFVDPASVEYCVQWRQEWLRDSNYAPHDVQWNASFDFCGSVRIMPDGIL
jgi:hypothetical protein